MGFEIPKFDTILLYEETIKKLVNKNLANPPFTNQLIICFYYVSCHLAMHSLMSVGQHIRR